MSSKITATISARVPHDIKAMIDSALELGHSSMRGVMSDFARKLHSGELELQNDRIVIPELYREDDGLDLRDFLEACESKGVKPQDAINRAAQMVWRG